MYFADLPGYGYAKISKSISAEWPKFIEPYLAVTPNSSRCACAWWTATSRRNSPTCSSSNFLNTPVVASSLSPPKPTRLSATGRAKVGGRAKKRPAGRRCNAVLRQNQSGAQRTLGRNPVRRRKGLGRNQNRLAAARDGNRNRNRARPHLSSSRRNKHIHLRIGHAQKPLPGKHPGPDNAARYFPASGTRASATASG